MPIAIHDADKHLPFRHFLVTTPVQVVIRKQGRQKITSIIGGSEFVICAFCKHWVERAIGEKCQCPASCHAEVTLE